MGINPLLPDMNLHVVESVKWDWQDVLYGNQPSVTEYVHVRLSFKVSAELEVNAITQR